MCEPESAYKVRNWPDLDPPSFSFHIEKISENCVTHVDSVMDGVYQEPRGGRGDFSDKCDGYRAGEKRLFCIRLLYKKEKGSISAKVWWGGGDAAGRKVCVFMTFWNWAWMMRRVWNGGDPGDKS